MSDKDKPGREPREQQTRRDDSKLDLNAQGRQGSGSTARDQASNDGSGYDPGKPTRPAR